MDAREFSVTKIAGAGVARCSSVPAKRQQSSGKLDFVTSRRNSGAGMSHSVTATSELQTLGQTSAAALGAVVTEFRSGVTTDASVGTDCAAFVSTSRGVCDFNLRGIGRAAALLDCLYARLPRRLR